jgi:hypothetical protein
MRQRGRLAGAAGSAPVSCRAWRDALPADVGYNATRSLSASLGGPGDVRPADVIEAAFGEDSKHRKGLRPVNKGFRPVREVFRRAELISRATARAVWHYVSPLTHDARGRRTLAANVAAHAALFALLLTLVQMLYAG